MSLTIGTITQSATDRQRENEAFLEALKKCDDDTYQAVIAILRDAKLLPE